MVWVFGIGTGFDLTTRDSYFTILVDKPYFSKRHVSRIIYKWTEHKLMVLKSKSTESKSPKLFGNDDLQHHPFLYQTKV